MKLSKNPVANGFLFGAIVFVLVFAPLFGYGLYIARTAVCPTRPDDPCDWPAMAFVSFATVGFFGGLLLAVIASIVAGIVTAIRNRKAVK